MSFLTLQGQPLFVHTRRSNQTSSQLIKSQNQAHSLKHISGQKMTLVAKWCQLIDCLPYKKIVLIFSLTLQGWKLSIPPKEAIQPLLNCFKSQSQELSIKHICRQNMTFDAKYHQVIAYSPYINRWGMHLFDSTRLCTVHPHLRKPSNLFLTVSQINACHILSIIFVSQVI